MNKYLLTLLFNFISIWAFTQSNKITNKPDTPALVVGIVVDQMRYDYLFRYWDKLGNNGFKRMIREGFFCKNTNFNYVPTYTGPGHASIYTGSTPSIHGIIANDWFNKNQDDTLYCVGDKTVKTVGANNKSGAMSPRNLLTTTIMDELKLVTNFQSKTFGISMKDRGAILPAGHSANAAYWFDSKSGNWVTSTYYMTDLPEWVTAFNAKKIPDSMLTKPWNTMLPIDQYTEGSEDDSPYEEPFPNEQKPVFPHLFPVIKEKNFELIRRSPLGNTLTVDFAKMLIVREHLGKNKTTDFLSISFSCTDYVGHQFGTYAIETEDTYLRLDKDLEELFNFLDKEVGLKKTLIFLTADHGAAQNAAFMNDHKLPGGNFPFLMVKDSLNAYLKSKFGNERWVSCFDNNQVFLNENLLEAKNMNKHALALDIASFLMRFKDIAAVLTSDQLNQTQFTEIPRSLVQKGFNAQRSGDVVIILNPSILDWEKQKGTTHAAPWSYDTHIPLLWLGWKINPGESLEPVNITDIAPTLSFMLNTAFPSGNTGKPINFLKY
jgi:predicted AlkP superfamily pyrophosphatase or phosphodiesterase